MAVWLFSTFLGRAVLALCVWTIGGLIVTDDTSAKTKMSLRQASGKTPVVKIVQRVFAIYSVPVWILFVLFGYPWLSMPGEIKAVWDQPIQTDWGYVVDNMEMMAAWYAGVLIAFVLVGIASTGAIDSLYRDDPEHQAWRRGGGQSFIDNLPTFMNPDSDAVRNAIPPSVPPTTCCPHCQGELTLSNGCQCGNCGVFWNGYQWLVPS